MSVSSYILSLPDQITSCVLYSSPHSGREYPQDFLAATRLDALAIRSSEDAFVDRLFESVPKTGAPLLLARYPRAYLDLNRSETDLDPALVLDAKGRNARNPRVEAGLGVIPRVVAEGQVIREGKMPLREALRRIAECHRPYHSRLASLMQTQRTLFGAAVLIDCHSMPHAALATAPRVHGVKPDVVLGDRFGASSDRWISDAVAEYFREAGFTVARNAPFAGGYITQTYGRPARGLHAVQIEIDRSLYMDEAKIIPNTQFAEVQARLNTVIARISRIGPIAQQLAAE